MQKRTLLLLAVFSALSTAFARAFPILINKDHRYEMDARSSLLAIIRDCFNAWWSLLLFDEAHGKVGNETSSI